MKHFFLSTAIKTIGLKTIGLSFFGLIGLSALSIPAGAEDFKQALVSAYQNNPRLMAERMRVREIDENYVQAQAAGRFSLNANAQVGRNVSSSRSNFFGNTSDSTSWQTPHATGLTIVQPLYQGGRVSGLKAQAKAGILAARQGLRSAEQNLLLSTATAYLDVLRDEEAANIRRNNVRVLTRQKFAAKERFDVGEGTRTDIAQADARLAAAEIGLANADASLSVSRAAYLRFVGHAPAALSAPPKFVLPTDLSQAMNRARANNPRLIAARYNENVAQSAIQVAKSAGRPSLALNGSLQGARESSANFPRSESASVTAQLRIPIYSGGYNQSRVRAAKLAKIRSKFETRETEQVIDQSVANLWAQVTASERALSASKKQVAAAEIAFEGVELEQQVGTRNTLDVLDAEQELLNAKLSVVQAERNLNVATYQLLVTIGGFDAYALQLPVDHYDPRNNFNQVTANPFEGYFPKPIEKIGKQLPNVVNDPINLAKPYAKTVGNHAKDLITPVLPPKIINGATISTPHDPGVKAAIPEKIDPQPILIVTETKPKTR